jgi:signal transduction histidine kinase
MAGAFFMTYCITPQRLELALNSEMENAMVIEERYTPEQLDQLHQQLWHCVLEFANVSAVQERNRIARDLHDSLGSALTALNMRLQTAMKLCQPDPTQAQETLSEAHRLVSIATQEMRHSVRVLRDDALETQSFETLIKALIQDFYQTTQVLPTLEIDEPIPDHLKIPLYRLIQEALNNSRKYAQATTVQIQIQSTPTEVFISIQDDGRGFDRTTNPGYGLTGMQERIALLQGTLMVDSAPGQGCWIMARIPMHLQSERGSIDIGEWQPLNLTHWMF